MGLLTVLTIVVVGLVVGLVSGLVGIGGGVLIVPFLYFFYDHPDLFGVAVDPEVRTLLAHGTSLFVIFPTSIRGALAFHRARLVEWRAVWPIGAASVLAAVVGARVALALPPEVLKMGFGILLVYSGVRMFLRRPRPADAPPQSPRLTLLWTALTGLAVGLFSALLGVGGGIIAIPLLINVMHVDVKKVAATSIGIITITAAAGAASYMWTGFDEPGLPPYSVGYVHVAAGLLMFVGSVVSVRWGALLNQRMRPRTLTLMFAGLFVVLGLRLVVGNAQQLLLLATAFAG